MLMIIYHSTELRQVAATQCGQEVAGGHGRWTGAKSVTIFLSDVNIVICFAQPQSASPQQSIVSCFQLIITVFTTCPFICLSFSLDM